MRGAGQVGILALWAAFAEFGRCRRLWIAALALLMTPTFALPSIFDDGNDRALVRDLMRKKKSDLSEEEKAILMAANRGRLHRIASSGDQRSPRSPRSDRKQGPHGIGNGVLIVGF